MCYNIWHVNKVVLVVVVVVDDDDDDDDDDGDDDGGGGGGDGGGDDDDGGGDGDDGGDGDGDDDDDDDDEDDFTATDEPTKCVLKANTFKSLVMALLVSSFWTSVFFAFLSSLWLHLLSFSPEGLCNIKRSQI